VFLVGADLLLLTRNDRRLAGIGIGIATAIKLTPGIFIIYLIVTRRYRAAAVASGTALAATLLAGAVAPESSREFWTHALWRTDRVGDPAFVSNQSLNGIVARLNPQDPSKLLWVALVVAVLAVWAYRSRRAVAAGDEVTGFALTGIVGVLISPITWVHHLVWVLPALVLLVDRAVGTGASRRRQAWLLGLALVAYGIMCSRLVWVFNGKFESLPGWFGSNAYVWLSLILLVALPHAATPAAAPVPRSATPAESLPDTVDARTAAERPRRDRSLVKA
jgi:alpha-1,2-mannosyltransferase